MVSERLPFKLDGIIQHILFYGLTCLGRCSQYLHEPFHPYPLPVSCHFPAITRIPCRPCIIIDPIIPA